MEDIFSFHYSRVNSPPGFVLVRCFSGSCNTETFLRRFEHQASTNGRLGRIAKVCLDALSRHNAFTTGSHHVILGTYDRVASFPPCLPAIACVLALLEVALSRKTHAKLCMCVIPLYTPESHPPLCTADGSADLPSHARPRYTTPTRHGRRSRRRNVETWRPGCASTSDVFRQRWGGGKTRRTELTRCREE